MPADKWGWKDVGEFMAAVAAAGQNAETEIAGIGPDAAAPLRAERSRMSRNQLLELIEALERQIAELQGERS